MKRLRVWTGFFRQSPDTAPSSEKEDQNHAFVILQIMSLTCPVSGNKQLEIQGSSENRFGIHWQQKIKRCSNFFKAPH